MGGWLSDLSEKARNWRDDMKGTFVFDAAKSVGRAGGNVLQHASVPVGSLLFGPLGGLAGMPLSVIGGQIGPNENRGAQLKRDLITGAAITAGTSALSLATGQGLGGSLISSFSSLFGWGSTPPQQTAAKPMTDEELYRHYFTKTSTVPQPKSTVTGGLLDLANKLMGGTQANPANLQQQYLDQLELAKKYRAAGDLASAQAAEALAEVYRRQLGASGQPVPAGALPLGLILLVAGGAWLLLRRKK